MLGSSFDGERANAARMISAMAERHGLTVVELISGVRAQEYQDRVRIAKLNIDENPQTPPKFGIRGIPTLILFKNGSVEAQKVGALSKSQLATFLDQHL